MVGEDTTFYQYEENGRKSSVTYPDGTTQNYQYDKKNQITKLVNQLVDKRVISTYQYTYDGAGNQLTKIEEKGTTTYQYDSLNRLSKVAEPEGKVTSYTYDKAGNRITEQVEIGNATVTTYYTYNEQNRLMKTLTSSGEETVYLYDKNGNLTSKSTSTSVIKSGELLDDTMESTELPNISIVINRDTNNGTGTEDITTYSYNHYNRMTQMKSKDVTASYLYNAQGYRVEKVINGNTTSYLYEGDKVVLETDKDNNQIAYQVYGANLLYRDVAKANEQEAQQYYYIYNAHGDVTSLIDASGNIVATYDYDAFGNIISETGNANNSIKYAGYQHDKESGLYYLNARYYDSTIARFITEDTYYGEKTDPLSLNLYTYCHNNPIIYFDPSGHEVQYKKDYFVDINFKEHPLIELNSKGQYVYKTETYLMNLGYDINRDGIYGSDEVRAVMNYQRANKQKITGKVDTKTFYSLHYSVELKKYERRVETGSMTQKTYNDYKTQYEKELSSNPKYQNPNYSMDIYTYYYSQLFSFVKAGCIITEGLMQLLPGAEAIDVSILFIDILNYKKGDEWKIILDLVALGIDYVNAVKYCDEIIEAGTDVQKAAKKAGIEVKGASKTVDNFINKNVNSNFQQAVKEAFTSDAKVTTLTNDVTVYRYYGKGSNSTSYWYTPYKTSNPAADLALPPGNSYQYMDTYVIPKGTTILEGTVSPNFGQPGGGYQYYVPDPTVVKLK